MRGIARCHVKSNEKDSKRMERDEGERAFKAIEDFQAQVQYAHIIQRYVQHSNGHDAHRHHHDAEHVQAQAYK
jgi:hypothetical protein